MSDRLIQSFWRWFATVSNQFGPRFENAALLRILDTKISELGGFAWEVGPGVQSNDDRALVLSPGGDPGLLAQTERMVEMAPDCPGWEFYSAKPPKVWDRRVKLEDEGDEWCVDASGARYVLLRYPDGVFDVVIADVGMAALPKEMRQVAAEILLDG